MQTSVFTFLGVIFVTLDSQIFLCTDILWRPFIMVSFPGHSLRDLYTTGLVCISGILNLENFLSDFEGQLGGGTCRFSTKFHSY